MAGISYLNKVPKWFPDSHNIYRTIIDFLNCTLPESPAILDVGAGTGNLTKLVLRKVPNCHVTLFDFSQNMLKEAEKILSKYNGRYEVIIGDFFKNRLLSQKYDAVVSSFAIHHGRTRASYLNLYKKIFRALKKRGVFVCADVLEGANGIISRINETGWINHMLKHYDKSAVDLIIESYKKEDSPVSIDAHFDLLKTAGFSSCDILWKKYNFGIYTGFK